MVFSEADQLAELFKGIFPFYFLIALPLILIISPACPVCASREFPVYRMQHFDLQGFSRGSRSAPVNFEARALMSWSTARHCVVTRLQDLTIDHYMEIRAKAGALLVVLPKDVSKIMDDERQALMLIEKGMLKEEIFIPVYFTHWTPELQEILDDVATSKLTDDKAATAAQALMHSVSANGYQIFINVNKAAPRKDFVVSTIHGKLNGYVNTDKLPTIALVAHYDSFGIAPELSFGADSNGSGVAALLELARLFSHLYSTSQTHAKANLVFILSGGGKMNYLGSKKWLEENVAGSENSVLLASSFAICLDTIGTGDNLYLHVSKPPKDNSSLYAFHQEFRAASGGNVKVELIHKRVNLADDLLAWEHERFSIVRLPAFTLSSIKNHKDPRRRSILDLKETVNVDKLVRNTQILAEALANHIYNISYPAAPFSNDMGVEKEAIKSWIEFIGSQPRSPQLLPDLNNPLLLMFNDVFSRYLTQVKVSEVSADKRDPEFTFYDTTKAVVQVYSVKPAVFDLFLTFAIALYLGAVYLCIQKFPLLYAVMPLFSIKKNKVN